MRYLPVRLTYSRLPRFLLGTLFYMQQLLGIDIGEFLLIGSGKRRIVNE